MPILGGGVKLELFQEHLRGDPLWKALAEYKKAIAENLEEKIAFQRKEISLFKERTGYEVVDEQAAVGLPAVIYITITGPIFFGAAMVKTNVSNILSKLDLRDRMQTVAFAYESGIVQPRTG
jgi:hypothetical protein